MTQIRSKISIQFGLIKAYKKIFGDLNVPVDYVVPKHSHLWNKEFQGSKIGKHVTQIRQSLQRDPSCFNSEDIAKLVKEGFIFNAQKEKCEKILQGVQWYKQLYGNCSVEDKFIVPKNDSNWPHHLHGFDLGKAIYDVKNFKVHKHIHGELTALGVNLRFERKAVKKINLAPFEIYKSIHGDLKMPPSFIVPMFDTKWPKVYWGFELGDLQGEIRRDITSGRNSFDKSDTQHLIEMGLSLKGRDEQQQDRNNRVLLGVQTFKEKFGHVDIPYDFSIDKNDTNWPENTRDFNLGHSISRARNNGQFYTIHLELKQLDVNMEPFNPFYDTCEAIEIYKSIHGNCNIDSQFIIPQDDERYPRKLWGLKLGHRISNVKYRSNTNTNTEHLEKLEELGVNLIKKTTQSHHQFTFQQIYTALECYKSQYGDVHVKQSFKISEGDRNFPKDLWGMNLGKILNGIRMRNQYSEYRTELEAIGVSYDVQRTSPKNERFLLVKSALAAFKTIHNNSVTVPVDFVVPQGDERYPVESWGLKLGFRLLKVRSGRLFKEFQTEFAEMGVKISDNTQSEFQLTYSALEAYKTVHGDCMVPNNFVVPQGDIRYPVDTWGMQLGRKVYFIRAKDNFAEHRSRLEALGLVYGNWRQLSEADKKRIRSAVPQSVIKEKMRTNPRFSRVFAAFEAYKKVHGNLKVPNIYVVPQGDVNYPEKCWGLKLGSAVNSIRISGSYALYRKELTKLGFNYKKCSVIKKIKTKTELEKTALKRQEYFRPLRIKKFTQVKQALIIYKQLHGHLLVPSKFLIPQDDVNYPSELWGLRLGYYVISIRCSEHKFSEFRDELNDIGFHFDKLWVVKKTSGIDTVKKSGIEKKVKENVFQIKQFNMFYSALEAYKMIHGDCNVRGIFVVPRDDVRYPVETWGMPLGRKTSSVRRGDRFVQFRAKLEALGVIYNDTLPVKETVNETVVINTTVMKPEDTKIKTTRAVLSFDIIHSSLLAYQAIHGDCLVPYSFVVPQGDVRYLVEMWGIRLGERVYAIKTGHSYAAQRAIFEALGIVYNDTMVKKNVEKHEEAKKKSSYTVKAFQRVYSALSLYKQKHGDLLIPQKFVVSQDDSHFPSEFWGMKLGRYAMRIRANHGYFAEHKSELIELGFHYDKVVRSKTELTVRKPSVYFERMYSSLKAYKAIRGDCLVPYSFVVPLNDSRYPVETWGMKLGAAVYSTRAGKSFAAQRSELEELGFVYKDSPPVVEID